MITTLLASSSSLSYCGFPLLPICFLFAPSCGHKCAPPFHNYWCPTIYIDRIWTTGMIWCWYYGRGNKAQNYLLILRQDSTKLPQFLPDTQYDCSCATVQTFAFIVKATCWYFYHWGLFVPGKRHVVSTPTVMRGGGGEVHPLKATVAPSATSHATEQAEEESVMRPPSDIKWEKVCLKVLNEGWERWTKQLRGEKLVGILDFGCWIGPNGCKS